MDEALTTPAVVLLVGLALAVVATAVVAGRRRAELRRELLASRAQVDRLAAQVERLADQVAADRTEADRLRGQDREYVITSMIDSDVLSPAAAEDRSSTLLPDASVRLVPDPPSVVAARIEQRLVQVLAQEKARPGLRAALAEAAVKVMALGSGLQHALSPDVRDRAAAEARVASRRSRRERRRELREAQRLLRSARQSSRQSATQPGRQVTSAEEGAA